MGQTITTALLVICSVLGFCIGYGVAYYQCRVRTRGR